GLLAGSTRIAEGAACLTCGGADGSAYWSEPVVAVGFGAFSDGEEFRLQCEGDWSGDAFADLDVVDGTNGSDFDGGAHEENFVGNVEHFARDDRFLERNVKVRREFDHGIAGNAGKNAGA